MATKAPMKDMVVILPGILGSVLQKDGKDLWAISGQSIWNFLANTGEAIKDLKLEQDHSEAFDLGDGIQATRLMADTHLVPGLVKIDGYTQTSKLITDNFQVTPGDIYNDPENRAANFYHFPYDWRRDNRASAHILKFWLDKRLKCWREASGAQDAKVILMAHSMGGLVSRYYLEVLGGWQDSRALFTFGTPYRGSFNAVNFIANGYKKLFLDLTEVLRSLTSVYQLLPIYQGIKIGDDYVRAAEADNLPNFDKAKAQDALQFHREIEAVVEAHRQDEAYRTGFTTVPIVGIKQPTLQSAELINGQLVVSENLPKALEGRPDLGEGDGTVPQVSAIPIELSNSFNNTFIAESHGALQNQKQIMEDLKRRLETTQFGLAGLRAPVAAISLGLDDLYLPDEAIILRARVTSDSPIEQLTAEITAVDSDTPARKLPFEQQAKQWTLTVGDLPSGLYRVTVTAGDGGTSVPSPVHNMFEVVRNP
ncbi:Lecithin:cholesterol acyltransferase [Leptolyngbya sp. PCC 7375]|nr:Lecithin:cholesterol acyltransferase [Leptolyngbya sp. PCC 7375]